MFDRSLGKPESIQVHLNHPSRKKDGEWRVVPTLCVVRDGNVKSFPISKALAEELIVQFGYDA